VYPLLSVTVTVKEVVVPRRVERLVGETVSVKLGTGLTVSDTEAVWTSAPLVADRATSGPVPVLQPPELVRRGSVIDGVSPLPCDSTWKGSGSWTSIEYRQRSTGS